jgi:prepilin-type N-terminal cleavage/methylation domain-containing protein
MKEHGVTLVEMMAVLIILGIVSVVVLSRVAGIDDMELATKVNTVRNHIRYTQIMAMKRNDMTWGIKCDGTDYWVFRTATPTVVTEPDDTNNMVYLPGNDNKKIPLPEMSAFTFYFDKFGIPYTYQATDIVPITASQSIQIGSKTLTLTKETGFVE